MVATAFAYRTFNAFGVVAIGTWRVVDGRRGLLRIEGGTKGGAWMTGLGGFGCVEIEGRSDAVGGEGVEIRGGTEK